MNDFNKYGEPRSIGGMKPNTATRRNSGRSNRSGMQGPNTGHNSMRPPSPMNGGGRGNLVNSMRPMNQ